METYAVSPTTLLNASTERVSSIGELSSEDFFKLLVAELQQQDPLEPTGTGDMIAQVSQIRSIEQSHQLMTTLQQMTQQQSTAGATEMLGKFVEAQVLGPDGMPVLISGVVTGVLFSSDGTAVLELDTGEAIRATDVMRVSAPETADLPAGVPDEEGESAQDKSDATSRRL